MTDEQAVRLLQKQDTQALHWMITRYHRYVSSVICMVLGACCRPQDAEELAADVFYSVFSHAADISPGKLRAYLGAAARNRAKDFLRRQQPLPADLDELSLPDMSEGPESDLLRRERQQRVRQALEQLSADDREIFLRYYYYLQPAPQIAQAMGLTPGAVRTRLSRGRAVLKTYLSQEDFP